MNDNASTAAGTAMGLGLVLFVLVVCLAFYVFYCFCAKRICEKCGVNPGILIWIPIVNLIPLLQPLDLKILIADIASANQGNGVIYYQQFVVHAIV